MSRIATFPGTMESLSSGFPFRLLESLGNKGARLGQQFDGRSMFFDPFSLQNDGNLSAATGVITGPQHIGKSYLKKVMAIGLMSRPVGYTEEGIPIMPTLRTIGFKHLRSYENVCENVPLMGLLGGYNFTLATRRCINPFDRDVVKDLNDLMDVAIACLEAALEQSVDVTGVLATEIACKIMQQNPSQSPEVLAMIFLNLAEDDVRQFLHTAHAELRANLVDAASQDWSEIINRESTIAVTDILESARTLGYAMRRIFSGDFGQTFGGNMPLKKMLSAKVANFDMIGMNDRAIGLYSVLEQIWMAIASRDQRDELRPNLRMGDEAFQAYRSPKWILMRAREIVVSRRFKTFDLDATQYLNQISQVSSDEAVQSAAATILLSESARFIGQLDPGDIAGLAELKQSGLNSDHIRMIRELKRGEFCLILNRVPNPYFFRVQATSFVEPALRTDQALQEIMGTPEEERLHSLISKVKSF